MIENDYLEVECGACLDKWDEAHEKYFQERMAAGARWIEGIRWQVCQTDRPLPFEVEALRAENHKKHEGEAEYYASMGCVACYKIAGEDMSYMDQHLEEVREEERAKSYGEDVE